MWPFERRSVKTYSSTVSNVHLTSEVASGFSALIADQVSAASQELGVEPCSAEPCLGLWNIRGGRSARWLHFCSRPTGFRIDIIALRCIPTRALGQFKSLNSNSQAEFFKPMRTKFIVSTNFFETGAPSFLLKRPPQHRQPSLWVTSSYAVQGRSRLPQLLFFVLLASHSTTVAARTLL